MKGKRTVSMDIGSDRVVLSDLPPITQGFKLDFFRATGMSYFDKFNPEQETVFLLYILRRLRPSTTEEEVCALPPRRIEDIYNEMWRVTNEHFHPSLVPIDGLPMPTPGQKGKDVIWLPTPMNVTERMLDLAGVREGDTFLDPACGDGRSVVSAALRGAKAFGVDFNLDMLVLARERARADGVSEKANFREGDLLKIGLDGFSVIFLYLLPDLNLKLRPKLMALEPGTRIVSHDFDMGGWEPSEVAILGTKKAYLWIV